MPSSSLQLEDGHRAMNLAKAKYDNLAESPDELAFRRGDVLTVVDQKLEGVPGWWLCSLRGKQGIVPANRLQLLAGMYNDVSALPGKQLPIQGEHDYDVPRSWKHATGAEAAVTLGQPVYDSPKRCSAASSVSDGRPVSKSSTSSEVKHVVYDELPPSGTRGSSSPVPQKTQTPSVSPSKSRPTDSLSERSSLYDYPSSASDALSTVSSEARGARNPALYDSPRQTSSFSDSQQAEDPIYDNNTHRYYVTASSPTTEDNAYDEVRTGNGVSLGLRARRGDSTDGTSLYDTVPPARSQRRQLEGLGSLSEQLDLDSALQMLLSLQQEIHLSIAQLKSALSNGDGADGCQAVRQTLADNLSRLVALSDVCRNQALELGDGELAASLRSHSLTVQRDVETLRTIEPGAQQAGVTRTLHTLCSTITENVTKLAALLHGNITALFALKNSDDEQLSDRESVDNTDVWCDGLGSPTKHMEDDEYDYCELRQPEPADSVYSTPADTRRAPTLAISEDSRRYLAYYLLEIRRVERVVSSLLDATDDDASMDSVEEKHKRILVAVHKMVYMCDSLKRALTDREEALLPVISQTASINSQLCVSMKEIVLFVKEWRSKSQTPALHLINRPGQLDRLYTKLRSAFKCLVEALAV